LNNSSINIALNGKPIIALIDSGAAICCINEVVYNDLLSSSNALEVSMQVPRFKHVKGVAGQLSDVLCSCVLTVTLGTCKVKHLFNVVPGLSFPVIIGADFMSQYSCILDFGLRVLKCNNMDCIPLGTNSVEHAVFLCVPVTLPPQSRTVVPAKCDEYSMQGEVFLEPIYSENCGVGAKCICTVINGRTVYELLNTSHSPIHIQSGIKLASYSKGVQIVGEMGSAYPDNVPLDSAVNTIITNTQAEHVNNVHIYSEQAEQMRNTLLEKAASLNIDLKQADLTAEQKELLLQLLGEYRDVFAKDLSELEATDKYFHHIDTGESKPIRSAPYRVNPTIQNEIDSQIKDMLKAGVIEESMSPWQSPVVMVRKTNAAPGESQFRMAIDYRKLNAVTKPISFVMPKVDEAFDAIGAIITDTDNTLLMSVLDMRSGYWSISLDEESKPKTGFVTMKSVYQFRRLSFGLVNAPMSYQMIMQDVLRNLHWKCCLAYIDDVLVYSPNFQSHIRDLREVFQRIREAKLKLHPKKCQFAASEVRYLGSILSRKGVQIDPEKTKAISEISQPKTVHDIRVFLGCTNYFRKFIRGYSAIVTPLTRLTRKDVDYVWSDDCQRAFEQLKSALLTAPVLRYPEFKKMFILSCDASDKAIGYVLCQCDANGAEYAIAFGGRALAPREQKYSVSERECLAVVEGIRQYRIYLATAHFKVVTDHFSLQYLKTMRDLNGRLGRWALFLQGYDFDISYRAGRLNTAADGLSRNAYQTITDGQVDCEHVECELLYTMPTNSEATGKTASVSAADIVSFDMQVIVKLQREDETLKPFFEYILEGTLPTDDKAARKLMLEATDYVIDDDTLYHLYYPRGKGHMPDRQIKQLVVPMTLRDDVLRSFHDSPLAAHQGADRMYAAIRQRYFLVTMYKDTQAFARSCLKCQESNPDLHGSKALLKPLPVGETWSRLHIDVCGPFTKSVPDGYSFLLVVTCAFSKWVEAFCLKTQTAEEIAWLLYSEIFCRFGAPRSLMSDRGSVFMSELVTELCRLFTVTKLATSSFHPQCNSSVERMNGFIVTALRKYCKDDQTDWPKYIPGILCAYRVSPATESTMLSPYFLLFGRECRLPLDQTIIPNNVGKDAQRHLNDMCKSLEISQVIAKENILSAQAKYSAQYNKKAKQPTFEVGDKVLLKVMKVPTKVRPKLFKKFTGPYYICLKHENYTYSLRNCCDNILLNVPVHANRLKSFIDRIDMQDEITSSSNIYFVERIVSCKMEKGKQLYLIKWKGYKEKTWEPVENLPQWLVQEFHIAYTRRGTIRKHKSRMIV
jgi:hypothetical protein